MNYGISVLSGGLDSTVSTLLCKKDGYEVITITFDYGQRASEREINSSKKISQILGIKHHHVINLDFLKKFSGSALTNIKKDIPELKEDVLDDLEITTKSMRDVWVPARNMIMFSIGSGISEYYNSNVVYTGINKEEGVTFPDNTLEFVNRFNSALEYGTLNKVKLVCPLYDLTKPKIVKLGHSIEKELGVEVLRYSYSCYHDNGRDFLHCGTCESCQRRKRAFKEAGIPDPTEYVVD